MKRLISKRPFVFFLILLMTLSFSSQCFAHDGTKSMVYNNSMPIQGVSPSDGYPDEPIGTLTDVQLKELQKAEKKVEQEAKKHLQSQSEVSANHWSSILHTHYVDSIYSRYDGYTDRGEVASGYNGKSTTDTLGFSITKSIANQWNSTIGFSADTVSASVGYNVTYTEEKTWSYSSVVSPYKTVHIGMQDWYHTQKFYCHTWYWGGYPLDYTENGNGWAGQWYKAHFYSWET